MRVLGVDADSLRDVDGTAELTVEVVETPGSVELALYHLCFFTNGKYGVFSEPLTSKAVLRKRICEPGLCG